MPGGSAGASEQRPAFLITIDTEGDNAWSRQARVETRNARFLPRFQDLCESFGFAPTYLTNHEMACDPDFVAMARRAIKRGAAEVGMHLHAWDSPPIAPLTDADHHHHPYLIDFPVGQMAAKIDHMTKLLEDTFGMPMVSHRAGRWAFDETYAALLVERGYLVDCSVTPGHSWAQVPGAPGRFGTDYAKFPDVPYLIDLKDIRRPGGSPLLEIPMTIQRSLLHRHLPRTYQTPLVRSVVRRLSPPTRWLRPTGRNLPSMLGIVDRAVREERSCIEFMIHSSEFMPGGSPYFSDRAAVEKLYADLTTLFERVARTFVGSTLRAFRDAWPRIAGVQKTKVSGGAGTV